MPSGLYRRDGDDDVHDDVHRREPVRIQGTLEAKKVRVRSRFIPPNGRLLANQKSASRTDASTGAEEPCW